MPEQQPDVYTVRPARMEDHPAIASFTKDTFSWGDYVTRVYKDWIADPDGFVAVAVDAQDRPVAMAKIGMLSPTEAWAQGARVHPEHRRRGLATMLSDELNSWAAERGAAVVRLVVEDWNKPAIAQVTQMGMRPTCAWVMADRPIGSASPVPEGNGGQRVPGSERLRRAPSPEAEPAYLSWGGGPLVRAARGLFAIGWSFRKLTVNDLAAAAASRSLFEGHSGWAMAAIEGDRFRVSWVETRPDSAQTMVRALVDAALDAGAESIELMLPAADWLRNALQRLGFDLNPMTVYARAL